MRKTISIDKITNGFILTEDPGETFFLHNTDVRFCGSVSASQTTYFDDMKSLVEYLSKALLNDQS